MYGVVCILFVCLFYYSHSMEEEEKEEVVKEGYLVKRGNLVKSWKKRWFELTEKRLKYYKLQGEKCIGWVWLSDIQSIQHVEGKVFEGID